MTQAQSAVDFELALAQRLRAVAEVLCEAGAPLPSDDPARDASATLDQLVTSAMELPSPDHIWLLYAAVTATLPTPQELQDISRLLRLYPLHEATMWLLDRAFDTRSPAEAAMTLRLDTNSVIVDVDHCARHDLHTGIQQVVRRTLPIWARDHAVAPVVWTESRRCYRSLTQEETGRVLHWGVNKPATDTMRSSGVLVVPWKSVVILAETPPPDACDRLSALARYSRNHVAAIGYDCIPVVSADLVAPQEPDRFTRYLTVIKHSRRVAAISESAASEFTGFSRALIAQGLRGPSVIECPLPATSVTLAHDDGSDSETEPKPRDLPLILSVGSFEPRKNQLAMLYAAERLWREGLAFEVLLVAGSAWNTEIPHMVAKLQRSGRPIKTRIGVSDSELVAAYRQARFTVFPSLHEGYGLPVAESLSLGTPVITANYGSTREIGSERGALLIDPRDDEALVEAMRRLLTDDGAVNKLKSQIHSRPERSWEQYAGELWEKLVRPELGAVLAEASA